MTRQFDKGKHWEYFSSLRLCVPKWIKKTFHICFHIIFKLLYLTISVNFSCGLYKMRYSKERLNKAPITIIIIIFLKEALGRFQPVKRTCNFTTKFIKLHWYIILKHRRNLIIFISSFLCLPTVVFTVFSKLYPMWDLNMFTVLFEEFSAKSLW